MNRKRHCYYCPERAVVADLIARPATTIKLDGTVERWMRWESRYLCVTHEHLDPWEDQ